MALDVKCPKCQHQMKVAEALVGRQFVCPQCKALLVCLVGGAAAEADVAEDLQIQDLAPSEHLNSRPNIKARGRTAKPAWRMPAQRKGKMKRLF